MPRMFKTKNLSAQRKKNTAAALGVRVKPTGRLRRNSAVQVFKQVEMENKNLPHSAARKFRVTNFRSPWPGQREIIGTRMAEKNIPNPKLPEVWNYKERRYEPQTEKRMVPEQYIIRKGTPDFGGIITLKRIKQSHKGPRVAGTNKQKTFGGIKEQGKRETFQSRKSKRRA